MDVSIKVNGGNIAFEDARVIPTEKETIACLLSLLESLSYEVCNGDVWWLAKDSASRRVQAMYNVDSIVFNEVMERFEKARKSKNKENPMASMF